MSERLYFNGVHGATGGYGQEPLTTEALAERIQQRAAPPDNLRVLKGKLKQDATRRLMRLLNETFADETLAALDTAAARAAWMERVLLNLETLPLTALDLITDTSGLIRAGLQVLRGAVAARPEAATSFAPLLLEIEALLIARVREWEAVLDALGPPLRALTLAPESDWTALPPALKAWLIKLNADLAHLGVMAGVDPTDLAQAGWGVIFAAGDARVPQLKAALAPLLEMRQAQAGALYRVYEGANGYRPDETARAFLGRHGADPAQPVDPEKSSYYMLIVGDPELIPFDFQHQLDVQHAVGRLDFGEDYQAYANYARSVVAAEQNTVKLARRAAFFGVANPDDRATQQSAQHLIRPLATRLRAEYADWDFTEIAPQDATKARLVQLLQEDAPAFWLSASHGLEFDAADPRQTQLQGALLCQDWPGPNVWRGEIPPEQYLSAADFAPGAPLAEANLLGSIAFFFACYGAGTPRYDQFARHADPEATERAVIADPPFVAALPQAMLALSRGGALAVIGHVERTWGTSFFDARSGGQIAVFYSALARLLDGVPVGEAMDYFNVRYAALSTQLTDMLDQAPWGRQPDPYDLARLWTENNDARGYIILGDPAVRLPVARADEAITGPIAIESAPVTLPDPVCDAVPDSVPQKPAPDRPREISAEDWENTPESVREYIRWLITTRGRQLS